MLGISCKAAVEDIAGQNTGTGNKITAVFDTNLYFVYSTQSKLASTLIQLVIPDMYLAVFSLSKESRAA